MDCPECGKAHRKYPVICITQAQNSHGYIMLRGDTPTAEQELRQLKVTEYNKWWIAREALESTSY